MATVLLLLIAAVLTGAHGYSQPTCADDRNVIVHLFNWKWTDIEKECAAYLGPKGFCGVQVSPPNEHRVISWGGDHRPWWERYQPVSYILGSRSGNREQFISMVETCHNHGVRIFVDMVVNHMVGAGGTGSGSAGSYYDADGLEFPGVPFGPTDFNCCYCSDCSSSDCSISNYGDKNQVRNCRLVGLLDLKLSSDYVRQKIADFFNDLIEIGVAGFRVDACKHMWPGDMEAMYSKVSNLNTRWFPANTQPFIFNEVIDLGGEAIGSGEYVHLGRITEFKYCNHIASAFRKQYPISSLKTLGEDWGMLPSGSALVFVDNHDNQRGHGAGGELILTLFEPRPYKLASAFKMAWPYGHVRILSSYRWPGGRMGNDGMGPPSHGDDSIKDVVINADGSCDDGSDHTWTCEHRWRPIGNMAEWRNKAGGEWYNVEHWWDNGGNQLSFSRNGAAFIAFNYEDGGTLSRDFQTGMPAGSYCDVISGDATDSGCTGATINVDGGGMASISIDASSEDPFVAIHVGACAGCGNGGGGVTPGPTTPSGPTSAPTPPPEGYQRTVVQVMAQTMPGQDLFVRGGIDHDQRPGCTENAATSACAVSITHNDMGSTPHYDGYNDWKVGDTKLDWYGAESGQGTHGGVTAVGTPLVWTSDDPTSAGYQPTSKGEHYWMVDMNMNCDETEDGWFEVKAYVTSVGWEGDINQPGTCTGTAGGSRPYSSTNHMARCGKINTFVASSNSCEIDEF